ncbi:unnamed protein product [Acanthoscelides obtectus]|uniref:Uncharacterized protein n=1 Tax=Acanthoscelides obtectus TaxID=200917 RepID=A0A9P0PTU6_ACAOB|nr:unnamed protein product [Acanthoscelides obtectus]CAK1654653.1 hypothetical protein AOBTE_LOCUS18741 [Acanthoscelides obtectus]
MFKCSALIFLAAVAASNAIPIGMFGASRWTPFGKTHLNDYTRNVFGLNKFGLGGGLDNLCDVTGDCDMYTTVGTLHNPLFRRFGLGSRDICEITGDCIGSFGRPWTKKFGLGLRDLCDVTGDCDINTVGTFSSPWIRKFDMGLGGMTIGDWNRNVANDRFVPEVVRKFANGGKIYDVVKKNQLGDVLELNDKHKLEKLHLLAGQNTVRDLINEQQEKALDEKEILDRLNLKEQLDMDKQKEKLDIMQKIQKEQLDKVHAIEDAKITGMVPDGGITRNMYGFGPFSGINDMRNRMFRGIY